MHAIRLLDRLRTSFWFLPMVMTVASIALSFALVEMDARLGTDAARAFGWIYSFGPEGARAILSAVAGSMITVAGLSFSMTMVTLQLASSQFGPRLLRSFMRDRGNQMVLGTFIATFVYCLLVLRTVRGTEGTSFVPHVSVAFGVLLAIASLAVLIFFIHHVATSIRIETVLAELADEARAAIDRLYPARMGRAPAAGIAGWPPPGVPIEFDLQARRIAAPSSGYVQGVDDDALMEIATNTDLVLRIEARPGRFVVEGAPLVSACPRGRVTDEVARALRGGFSIGPDRTPRQDVEFSIRRIVEIAQRALSPGINDPTTALYCIDRLDETLGRLAEREPPSAARLDDAGRLRVLTEVHTFDALACPTLAAVARYALSDADVIDRLLRVIERLRLHAGAEGGSRLGALAEAIRRDSGKRLALSFDRQAIGAETGRDPP